MPTLKQHNNLKTSNPFLNSMISSMGNKYYKSERSTFN